MTSPIITIPFYGIPSLDAERRTLLDAFDSFKWSGSGKYIQACESLLSSTCNTHALLTNSCTSALEIAALCLNISPGDEIIMPSWTFASTANAFALRGGVPVFIDVRPDTLNLDESLIDRAVTPRTRAICVVHYAGIPCDMREILRIAAHHEIPVVEDAAQAYGSRYDGLAAGALADIGTFSFHGTKSTVMGEGGAFLTRFPPHLLKAERIREKGTDRAKFLRGEARDYSWESLGSSYVPSNLLAAILHAQLQRQTELEILRRRVWRAYDSLRFPSFCRKMTVPRFVEHNYSTFWLLLPPNKRTALQARLLDHGIQTLTHFRPLHSSPYGKRNARLGGNALPVTEMAAESLLRLPVNPCIVADDDLEWVRETVQRALDEL